jgi:hypothetical protein
MADDLETRLANLHNSIAREFCQQSLVRLTLAGGGAGHAMMLVQDIAIRTMTGIAKAYGKGGNVDTELQNALFGRFVSGIAGELSLYNSRMEGPKASDELVALMASQTETVQ